MFLRNLQTVPYLLFVMLTNVIPAYAGVVLTENVSSTTPTSFGGFFGQSVTTPTGGPWDNITFSFAKSDGTPIAEGGLYALSQSYSDSPTNLSASTPGFLGFTNTISGGAWQFSGLTLNPSTQYFFYTSSAVNSTLRFSLSNPYTGGIGYNAVGSGTSYLLVTAGFDLNFSLQGDVVAVPEPSSMVFLGAAFSTLGLHRWRKRNNSNEIEVNE
jgi:hypothetical protein